MTTVDPIEARILGVLVEKQMTTPDTYPLTLAGVVAGANQSTNRHPVMSVTDDEAEAALIRLHDGGLATPVRRPGDRATKYRHKLAEALELGTEPLAVLAVLLLRGAQTSGELRQRTERYVTFRSTDEVEVVIDRLEEAGLARWLSRQPGQSQRRVAQLLVDEGTGAAVPPESGLAQDPDWEMRLALLEERFDELLRRLGETDL